MRTRTSIWLIVAAIALMLIALAAWVILPHQSEHWKAPAPKAPDAALVDRVLVIKRTEGLRIAGRGLSFTSTAVIPHLKDSSLLSEALFENLHATIARGMRSERHISWGDVWDAMGEKSSLNQWDQHISYEVITNSPQIVSLLGTWSEYTGGAHGNSGPFGDNYVWRDGQMIEVELADLFEPGMDWLAVLSKEVEAHLRRQKESFAENALPLDTTKLGTFTISGSGMTIYFAPYAVASYAEGTIHADVPWAKLRPYMKTDSPVAQWVDERMGVTRGRGG